LTIKSTSHTTPGRWRRIYFFCKTNPIFRPCERYFLAL